MTLSDFPQTRMGVMRRLSYFSVVVGALLAFGLGAAMAGQQTDQPETVSGILKMQHELRARLEKPSGEYSRFDATAIRKMEAAQDDVFSMLDGVQSLDQLNAEKKTRLSNSLDEIKAVLLANEGSRMICHRERKTGTNLVERRCETMANREANARQVNQQMYHDGIAR